MVHERGCLLMVFFELVILFELLPDFFALKNVNSINEFRQSTTGKICKSSKRI
jgi:hypothetical protein